MAKRDIIFLDINTIWHRRLAEALAEQARVVGVAPVTRPGRGERGARPSLGTLAITQPFVPPGWASKTAFIGQRLLLRQIDELAKRMTDPVIVLTSPAYLPLAKMLEGRFPVVTYTADDYASYEGWPNARQREAEMQRAAQLCVYVSDALRRRAVDEDGIPEDRTMVSANATEPRFSDQATEMPEILSGRPGPVLGVLGGLSDRLDLDCIEQVVGLREVGTFLVAGPCDPALVEAHPALKNEKVIITGRLPHTDMHRYARAMDAALIPYAGTRLNHFCSPMRLFDHLATGVPIYALPTCDQVSGYDAPNLVVAVQDDLLARISREIGSARVSQPSPGLYWSDRAAALLAAIERHCPAETEEHKA